MAYLPIQTNGNNRLNTSTSFMAKSGENLRDLPQLLDLNSALKIQNYVISSDGGIIKRQGITEFFSVGGTTPGVMIEKWTDDIYVFSYGTTLAYYRPSTDAITNITTGLATSGATSGAPYGDYFFVANAGEKISRLSQTLAYDAQSANFTAGLVVTGGASGATAVILEDSDAGTTGTLTLGNIVGTFQDNEAITDSGSGAATVNGTLTIARTTIANAPLARVVKAIGTRLYAADLETDRAACQYSEEDDGTNPPFTAWSNTTTATAGGKVSARNLKVINDVNSLGEIIILFGEEGKAAFKVDVFDSGGTISKKDTIVMFRNDFGGARGSISTRKGLFYINEKGLFRLVSVGQSDVPYSDQETLVSVKLGSTYFDNVTLDQADMVFDDKNNNLYVTVSNDASANNMVIGYNTEFKSFFRFSGWNINRFLDDNGTFYAIGSQANTVWKLFDGYDDDGSDIWTEFYQEVNVGAPTTRKDLVKQYIQGFMSQSTELRVAFDIYNREGRFVEDKLVLTWTQQIDEGSTDGYGKASFGGSGWGSGVNLPGTTENFDGFSGKIKNFQRIRIHITGNDQVPHSISFFSLITREKQPIRRRKLTQS